MDRICVIGGDGYVGKAMVNLFKNHNNHFVYVKEKTDSYKGTDNADLAIICVPTPPKDDGTCDTSIVEEVIKDSDAEYFLIKSTVTPGTTERLIKKFNKKIVFSPEYIGEGGYHVPFWEGMPHPTDMSSHHFQIFGGSKDLTNKFIRLFTPILGPHCKFLQTDATTAELTKYMSNAYIASKITFCHDFFNIAKAHGVDYDELRELWLSEGRINRGFTSVFDSNKLGFGGKCLPKDVLSLFKDTETKGYVSTYLKHILDINKKLKNE